MKNYLLVFVMHAITCSVFSQNVGIGLTSPAVRLDLLSIAPHSARFSGPTGMYVTFFEEGTYRGYIGSFSGAAEDVDFGTGGSNAAGKLHLTTMGIPKFTITPAGNVGIGTQAPTRKLEVAGSLGITGALYVNGFSGKGGEVLTSNASSAPTWQSLNSAYSNNVRFRFTGSNNTALSESLAIGTSYNTNATAVAVSGSNITFTQTGIYHFDVAISGRLDYPSALGYEPGFSVIFDLDGGVGGGNNPVGSATLQKHPTLNRYSNTVFTGVDFYITAGQVLNIRFIYGNAPAGYTILNTSGDIRGYLISE